MDNPDAESRELRVETLHDTPDARPQVHEAPGAPFSRLSSNQLLKHEGLEEEEDHCSLLKISKIL